jgi:outer membrane receptor protein involved in Fe transport
MPVALSLLAALAAASPQAAAEAPAQQGVTVYQPAFFASSGASTALDMVKRIPGFTLDTGASVRGYEGAAGNVLVDGARPASKTDPLDQILYRMPASQVDHIEVIRGGAPGVDMQGKSILANVVRKKTSGYRGLIAFANNSVLDDGRQKMGLRVEGSGPAGPGTLEASLRYGEYIDDGSGDGPHVSQDPSGKALQLSNVNSRGDGHQWETNLAYEAPVLGGKLRVNGRGFWDYFSYNEFNWFRLPADTLNRDHDHQDQTQTELGARYSHDLGPRARLELVGLRQTLDYGFVSTFTDPTGPTRFSLDKQTVETIGRGVLKYSYSPSLSLEAGAETAVNTLDSRTGFTQLGVAVALPAANVEVEEDRSELFAKAVWRPNPQWTVEGGLRYEMSSISASGDVTIQKDLKYAKPRLSVAWAPRAGTQIRARYEREVGQLNFDDFVASSTLASGVVTTGNPNINPEQAWVSELAIEQAFWGAGSTALTVRHYELTDAADRAPVFDSTGGVFDAPANIGDGTKDELQFDLTLPLDRLGVKGGRLQGTSTWRWTQVTDPTTRAHREISGLKPLEWEAHYTQDLPQWNAVWGVDVFGAWRKTYYRFDEISTDKLKTWVALFAEYKPRSDLVVRVELDNATERGFRHTLVDYAGPRNVKPETNLDDRDIQFGRMIYLRIRKSFG